MTGFYFIFSKKINEEDEDEKEEELGSGGECAWRRVGYLMK